MQKTESFKRKIAPNRQFFTRFVSQLEESNEKKNPREELKTSELDRILLKRQRETEVRELAESYGLKVVFLTNDSDDNDNYTPKNGTDNRAVMNESIVDTTVKVSRVSEVGFQKDMKASTCSSIILKPKVGFLSASHLIIHFQYFLVPS